jgi:hypothetical protein
LFQKFHVLCVTNGVLQKYLRILCITMIQNEVVNSISVYWKKLTGMSYIIKKVEQIVPIITVKSWFYFGNRNCRHEILIPNRTLADNRIVKALTLPKVYLNLLLVWDFPLRHAKLGISQKCVTYFTIMCCHLDNDGQLRTQQVSHVPWFSTFLLTSCIYLDKEDLQAISQYIYLHLKVKINSH